MTKSRNQKLVKQCMERDLGLCCCCGFKADEAHHIIPLTFGGEDTLDNMIAMCCEDHYHAPNTKEEFVEYIKHGGVKLDTVMGRAINTYFKSIDMQKEYDLHTAIKITKDLINAVRDVDINYCMETYGAKKSITIPNITLFDIKVAKEREKILNYSTTV